MNSNISDPNNKIVAIPDIKNIPAHVALVMDGNGRWAQQRGLPRTEGHKRGEKVLLDVVEGAIEVGIKQLSVYAFSTENWMRNPEEVRFLMGFNRDVLRRQRDYLNSLGVKIVWCGRKPKLWKSVIKELEIAEAMTAKNKILQLNMCINYGGQAEILDAINSIIADLKNQKLTKQKINKKQLEKYLYVPNMLPVDMFLRPSGELRLSNFLLWQIAYAELVFQDKLFPDFTKLDLWDACEVYARRKRRFGG